MNSILQQSLEASEITITAEVMPPRGGDPSKTIAAAKSLSGFVHAINVTDGSRAIMKMHSLAVCKLLLESNIEPILQIACRDKNRIALQAEILGAHALGIKNVLCLTGDPVRVGDQPNARPVHDYESVQLLKQITSLNLGEDPVSGLLPNGPTKLFLGTAADPNSTNFKSLRKRLERKKNAGARFIQTQMVMDPKTLEKFCKEIAEPLELPVLAGVFLLKSAKNAHFINKVVPGASIPMSILNRLEQAKEQDLEGITIAAEQARSFVGIAKGIHIMAIKAEHNIPAILNQAKISLPSQ
ncbi:MULTISPECIES: methylenetetrahydrofolate reductase [Prochlorococcus]|uniref:Methylenetetrahydrofolate reductase n=1 Tax=Prochlorococcus marinus (strain SARG / CCMP1375 / SS120) TaxID=167539 RepID=Q7VE38_PROMA|nr:MULTISPECIES: methylenetetrahydrofolate reductase [Prochlorococcus]AAP99222.1 5,10-methylenetetrahydrofolate reductase [Prochlorococcus marinus subsp. marinus str. CCMP1375]KGG11509.1 5,10-methylenetetrahydrofolate reductase [Prochlorococcus marinus str. LG]